MTVRTYLRDLTREGYAYRFRVDDRPLGAAEGAFLLCNCVVAPACDQLTARPFFERTRSARRREQVTQAGREDDVSEV